MNIDDYPSNNENHPGPGESSLTRSNIRERSSLDQGSTLGINTRTTTTTEYKKGEKIIEGKVQPKKLTFGRRLTQAVFSEDLPNVKDHIIWDVLIPSAVDTVRNSLINMVESLFTGGNGVGVSKRYSSGAGITYRPYSSLYSGAPANGIRGSSGRGMYDYDEMIFENRGEAEEVLRQLKYFIERYGTVSILDYYDMVGMRTRPSDANYGWLSVNTATIERGNGGYILHLPKAMPID